MLVAPSVRATDPFEIQVYDGTANDPWQPGLELHINHVASGTSQPDPPVAAPDHQSHFTLEPSLGLTPFWELGAYLQTAIVPDSGFQWAGSKLRSKFVTPPTWHPHLRLGANIELSLVPQRFDKSRWGTELRPIVAWEDERFLFAFNANVSTSLAGEDAKHGPEFEPAAMAVVKIAGLVSAGLEHYAGLGPFSGFLPIDKQEHYLYEVANLLAFDALELNVGVGEGLTAESNKIVVKMIVGYAFDTTLGGSATWTRVRTGPRGVFARRPRGRSLFF